MEPKVSIVMSTLNTPEKFLEESINSILNQTFNNFEFIIIIDGGQDYEIIKKFNDERIKIIKHNTSIGLTKSLNEGIKISKGKYIARMDSDDISLQDRIMKQVEYMEKNNDIDITSMYYERFGDINKKVREVFYKPNELKCKLLFTNVIAHPAVMIRKSFLEENKIEYNEEFIYSQDFELWTRACKKGNIAIIPEFGLRYRIHNKQISTEKYNIQTELFYKILKRNLEELEIGKENIKYILMLNGREKISNKKELKNFIKLVIKQNENKQIYDKKELKKVLKIYYNIACIKSKKIFLLNIPFLEYIIRKICKELKR